MTSAPGPQRPSAAVYRRRRIVVGVAALLVLALLVWGVVAGIKAIASAINGDDKQTVAPPTPSPSQSTAPSSTKASPAGANPDGSCPSGAVKVTASTDKPSYEEGAKAVLTLSLVNTLEVACTANVGTKAQEFLITSGSDRIFSTKDCQKDPKDYELSLEPGKKETANFTWELTRSQSGCTPVAVKPRAGTYTLQVSLGKVESEKVQFRLK